MAHKKAGGSSRNGRDSESKRLGVKRYGGQLVSAGHGVQQDRQDRSGCRLIGATQWSQKPYPCDRAFLFLG